MIEQQKKLEELEVAAIAALEYLDSPHFPHKSPLGNDRKPAAAALRAALVRRRCVTPPEAGHGN